VLQLLAKRKVILEFTKPPWQSLSIQINPAEISGTRCVQQTKQVLTIAANVKDESQIILFFCF